PIDGGPSFVAGGALLELTGQFWGAPFLRHDDKRQRILAAATAVFAERDFHRVLVSEVASRAGVGKGTVYLYFPTKDRLHRVALEASLERVAGEVERAAEADAPAEAVLREIVVSILRFFWRRPHLLTLVVRYEQRHTRSAGERRRRVMRAGGRGRQARRGHGDGRQRRRAAGRAHGVRGGHPRRQRAGRGGERGGRPGGGDPGRPGRPRGRWPRARPRAARRDRGPAARGGG